MNIKFDNVHIDAVTAYLPADNLEMSDLVEVYGEKVVKGMQKVTGVERLRVAPADMTSSDMCFGAAKQLIDSEGLDVATIDGLVMVSQTFDYISPSSSVILQDKLGLSKNIVCVDIAAGCSGYIYGILQASSWIKIGACKRVLVVTGDTLARKVNEKDSFHKMTFGDAATATLVSVGEGEMGITLNSDGSGYNLSIIPAGGFRMPCSDATKVVKVNSEGNELSDEDVYADGMAMLDFSLLEVPKSVEKTLDMMQWSREDVGTCVIHQTTKSAVNLLRSRLKIDKERVPFCISDFGNTGSSSMPLLMSDLYSEGGSGRSGSEDLSRVLMCGFGVGLSWGCLAADFSKTRFYAPVNR